MKTTISLTATLITLFTALTLGVTYIHANSPSPTPNSINQNEYSELGDIHGTLITNDKSTSQLNICAESITRLTTHCTSLDLSDPHHQYNLKVSNGAYRIYAFDQENPQDLSYYKTSYTCGIFFTCHINKPVDIAVAPGTHLTDINITL